MCKESNCEKEAFCLCPIRGIVDVVSKKWVMCVLTSLREDPLRYNQIKKNIGEISPKTLSNTLKTLEHEGLIERNVYGETPPRVEYSLTESGKELQIALIPLVEWVRRRENHDELHTGQKSHKKNQIKNST
ncbi:MULTISPECIES: winged helix-turn-helix transcriptional regulator [Methanobacterium]|jgi:DNA-binding HxlR family transcriptional regulator|uniref:Helix-turn-helix domain-containing protein n=1 Tax=Methanobacterium veterum TaxID=408577 RepID=A0A9E5DJL8_9EURY|nr:MULTISPECIES: helix-turn-helix domain-containing protein [Methanobacterium]MCZ3366193.1 helix-turn-helix domain-containing protein [Methanobacterium veterum]MCZ3371579.1 helix-turn-helix domain-containing protein [Methanobacterium veterum]